MEDKCFKCGIGKKKKDFRLKGEGEMIKLKKI